MHNNPWKVTATRLVYKNPWISVREDQVIRPDGKPGIYGVVESKIAAGVVALTSDLDVYIVGQYRYPINRYSWEIIEGGVEHGESPLAGIQRELREEAGLVAEEWIELGSEVHLSNCFTAEVAKFFLARDLTAVEASPEGTEVLMVKRIPFKDLLGMVESGEVTDAMTIIGTYRAARFLGL